MAIDRVGREPNQLNATFGEFWFEFRKCAELRRAHRSVILRVGEEDHPFVADEPALQSTRLQRRDRRHILVKIDGSVCGVCLEVRGS